jgi:large subunit ribosomal protein L24
MRKRFSPNWEASCQPRKQRKYRFNAPLHVRKKFTASHLSRELRKKYQLRSLGLRKGDRVKVMRGQFKGKTGKVERVDLRRDKAFIPIHPSKLALQELNLDDRRRREKLKTFETK